MYMSMTSFLYGLLTLYTTTYYFYSLPPLTTAVRAQPIWLFFWWGLAILLFFFCNFKPLFQTSVCLCGHFAFLLLVLCVHCAFLWSSLFLWLPLFSLSFYVPFCFFFFFFIHQSCHVLRLFVIILESLHTEVLVQECWALYPAGLINNANKSAAYHPLILGPNGETGRLIPPIGHLSGPAPKLDNDRNVNATNLKHRAAP